VAARRALLDYRAAVAQSPGVMIMGRDARVPAARLSAPAAASRVAAVVKAALVRAPVLHDDETGVRANVEHGGMS